LQATPTCHKEISVSSIPIDPDPKFAEYAHPRALVSTDWLNAHLGEPGLVVVESDEDILLYETGHIPGAVKVDWHTELNNTLIRDYVDGTVFAALMSAKGIARDDTIVIYGDDSNWWAAYALWVFKLFGHDDVRLLDGGRQKWLVDWRDMTTEPTVRPVTEYPVVVRDDSAIRSMMQTTLAHAESGAPLIDVRSPEEFTGQRTHMAEYPQEGVLRGGHIPGASSVPWKRAANEDGTFKIRTELAAIYEEEVGLSTDDAVVTYCRIGERSSHTWFALTYLLGFANVRNYDGSWTEWGNVVGVPIEKP
jgi:thiosulfate/3-mercaptopyruvate sulfurtransferase